MGHKKNIRVISSNTDKTIKATITLDFSRLWDLMSPYQKQYALHLSNPTRFPSVYEPDNNIVAFPWSELGVRLRASILDAFLLLPDVHKIS